RTCVGCTHCSNGCTVCSNDCTICSGCTHPTCNHPTCGLTLQTPQSAASTPETLAALKAQLQQAIADIEQQEQSMAESMQPQTIAEVNDLEAKLQGSLEELKKRRAELEQKPKK